MCAHLMAVKLLLEKADYLVKQATDVVLVSQVEITLTKRGKCESLLVQQGAKQRGVPD